MSNVTAFTAFYPAANRPRGRDHGICAGCDFPRTCGDWSSFCVACRARIAAIVLRRRADSMERRAAIATAAQERRRLGIEGRRHNVAYVGWVPQP